MASSKELVVVMPKKKPPPVVASIAETISKYSKPIFKKPVTTPKAEDLKQRTVPKASVKPEKPDVAPPPKKSTFFARWQYQFDDQIKDSRYITNTSPCMPDKENAMDTARLGLAKGLAQYITPEKKQQLGISPATFTNCTAEQVLRKMVDLTKGICWHRQMSSLISVIEIKPDGGTEEHFPPPDSVYRKEYHNIVIINFGW